MFRGGSALPPAEQAKTAEGVGDSFEAALATISAFAGPDLRPPAIAERSSPLFDRLFPRTGAATSPTSAGWRPREM
jgi:hypothetical protein